MKYGSNKGFNNTHEKSLTYFCMILCKLKSQVYSNLEIVYSSIDR